MNLQDVLILRLVVILVVLASAVMVYCEWYGWAIGVLLGTAVVVLAVGTGD